MVKNEVVYFLFNIKDLYIYVKISHSRISDKSKNNQQNSRFKLQNRRLHGSRPRPPRTRDRRRYRK